MCTLVEALAKIILHSSPVNKLGNTMLMSDLILMTYNSQGFVSPHTSKIPHTTYFIICTHWYLSIMTFNMVLWWQLVQSWMWCKMWDAELNLYGLFLHYVLKIFPYRVESKSRYILDWETRFYGQCLALFWEWNNVNRNTEGWSTSENILQCPWQGKAMI